MVKINGSYPSLCVVLLLCWATGTVSTGCDAFVPSSALHMYYKLEEFTMEWGMGGQGYGGTGGWGDEGTGVRGDRGTGGRGTGVRGGQGDGGDRGTGVWGYGGDEGVQTEA